MMQDDVYLIGSDGWLAAANPRAAVENKDRNIRETPDLVIERKKYKMDLIPPALLVARYFAKEQAAVDTLEAKREAAERELEEFVEENSGEEGLLEDAKTDKGTVTKAGVSDRLKEVKTEPESEDEQKALIRCLELMEAEAKAAKAVKEAQAKLDAKVLAQYSKLSEVEIKTLVVEDKWFAAIGAGIESEVQRLTQTLTNRVKELEERYAQTPKQLADAVEEASEKVDGNLKEMGLVLA